MQLRIADARKFRNLRQSRNIVRIKFSVFRLELPGESAVQLLRGKSERENIHPRRSQIGKLFAGSARPHHQQGVFRQRGGIAIRRKWNVQRFQQSTSGLVTGIKDRPSGGRLVTIQVNQRLSQNFSRFRIRFRAPRNRVLAKHDTAASFRQAQQWRILQIESA